LQTTSLKDKDRLRVFGNRVLRRVFVPKSDAVTGGWRKLNSEELHNIYSSPLSVMVIDGKSACMGR
jgi:hypothetical protein